MDRVRMICVATLQVLLLIFFALMLASPVLAIAVVAFKFMFG